MSEENNLNYTNDLNIDPPTGDTYNDILGFKRKLDIANESRNSRQRLTSYEGRINLQQQAIQSLQSNLDLDIQELESIRQSQEQNTNIDNVLKRKADEETISHSPRWFTEWARANELSLNRKFENVDRKFENIDRKFENIDRKFENIDRKFGNMDRKFEERFDRMEKVLNRTDFRLTRIENRNARENGIMPEQLPFLNGDLPPSELPVVLRIEDIDNLSIDQCKEYLRGYGVEYNANETINLKVKLKTVLGFDSKFDYNYRFRTFHTNVA